MGIFGKKKKIIKKKQTISDNFESTTHNKIQIKVYRQVSQGLLGLAAVIDAEERKDNNDNLFAINEENNFKEDLDFTIDRVYQTMNIELGLMGMTNKMDKLQKIAKEIGKQTAIVKKILADVKENENYNLSDEEAKLKQLRILADNIKRKDEKGAYCKLENGIRVYSFTVIDGILYPEFHGTTSHRSHPDLTVKKRIFNHEKKIFADENGGPTTKLIMLGIILCGIGALMVIIGGILNYIYLSESNEMNERINAAPLSCSNTLATCTQAYEELSRQCLTGEAIIETTNNINNEKPNNVIVDPTKLIPGIN